MSTMTKAEREDLKRLARERARVAKADAARRTADLKASFEEQVVAYYDYDRDEVWSGVLDAVKEALEEANTKIGERATELGIPDQFAPSVTFTWHRRDPRFQVKQSQDELRRAAYKRLDALERTAKHEIDRAALQVQTQLVAEGLTSDRAIEFMTSMPSVEALMPALDLLELVEGTANQSRDDFYGDDLSEASLSKRGVATMPELGLLCRCSVCGREERAGSSPLRNGWPKCHGYTMTLIDTQRFIDGIERAMGEVFEPVRAAQSQEREPA